MMKLSTPTACRDGRRGRMLRTLTPCPTSSPPACAPLAWEPLTVGIDIGGTKVLAAVVDPAGTVLRVDRRPTLGHDVRRSRTRSSTSSRASPAQHDVAAVGIGAAGFVDVTRTVVMFSPHLDWRREPLRARVAERVRLPVVVDNDANAAAIAETRFGAGRGHRFVLCVTLGHRHRRRAGARQPRLPRCQRDGGGVRPHAGRARRPPVRVRQPRVLGAVRLGQRAGPRRPRDGARQRRRWPTTCATSSTATPTRLTGPHDHPGRARRRPAVDRAAHRRRRLARHRAWPAWPRPSTRAASSSAAVSPTRASCCSTRCGRRSRARSPVAGTAPSRSSSQAQLGPNAGLIGAADIARSAARRSRRGRRPPPAGTPSVVVASSRS